MLISLVIFLCSWPPWSGSCFTIHYSVGRDRLRLLLETMNHHWRLSSLWRIQTPLLLPCTPLMSSYPSESSRPHSPSTLLFFIHFYLTHTPPSHLCPSPSLPVTWWGWQCCKPHMLPTTPRHQLPFISVLTSWSPRCRTAPVLTAGYKKTWTVPQCSCYVVFYSYSCGLHYARITTSMHFTCCVCSLHLFPSKCLKMILLWASVTFEQL